jgi:hypothetical protein
MKGDVLLQNIKVDGTIPSFIGKNAKESKIMIREVILTKLGKNFDNVKKRCTVKPVWINIGFFLHSESQAKKDLDNLSNVVLKVLGKDMSSKKDELPGLELVDNPNLIHRLSSEKKIIGKDQKEGFSFSIYEWE